MTGKEELEDHSPVNFCQKKIKLPTAIFNYFKIGTVWAMENPGVSSEAIAAANNTPKHVVLFLVQSRSLPYLSERNNLDAI